MFQLVNVPCVLLLLGGKNIIYLWDFFSHFSAPVLAYLSLHLIIGYLYKSVNKIDQQTFVRKYLLAGISKMWCEKCKGVSEAMEINERKYAWLTRNKK